MPATWFASTRDTVEWLSHERAIAAAIADSFGQIAEGWAHLPLLHPIPFSSGICPDGSPVELSVRIAARHAVEWRLIAQPYNPCLNALENLDYARARAYQFICDHSGHTAGQFVTQALSLYSSDARSAPAGNFYLWLGIAVKADGVVSSTKLYLNPWAAAPSSCPETIYRLFRLSNPPVAGSTMGYVHDLIAYTQGVPHIVGFNLTQEGVSSSKLYLSCPSIHIGTLQGLVERWPCEGIQREDQEAQSAFLTMLSRTSTYGEAHLTVAIKDGSSTPSLRISLFAPQWFSSDQTALHMLLNGNYVDDSTCQRLLGIARASRAKIGINFISMDAQGPTIYFNVACIQDLPNPSAPN